MSRQLKFRAWLKNGKWMEDAVEINFYDKTISYIEDDYINMEQRWIEEAFENIVLMQSTGLHDKNEKMIYEGDIVRAEHENYYDNELEDEPEYRAWIGEVELTDGTYSIQTRRDYNPYLTNIRIKSIEVIGNIFKNPELLESEGN